MTQTEIFTKKKSKFPFVSRIEFIRSKLSNFSAHVSGLRDIGRDSERDGTGSDTGTRAPEGHSAVHD